MASTFYLSGSLYPISFSLCLIIICPSFYLPSLFLSFCLSPFHCMSVSVSLLLFHQRILSYPLRLLSRHRPPIFMLSHLTTLVFYSPSIYHSLSCPILFNLFSFLILFVFFFFSWVFLLSEASFFFLSLFSVQLHV